MKYNIKYIIERFQSLQNLYRSNQIFFEPLTVISYSQYLHHFFKSMRIFSFFSKYTFHRTFGNRNLLDILICLMGTLSVSLIYFAGTCSKPSHHHLPLIHQIFQARQISAVQGLHHGCNKTMLPVECKYFSLVLLGCQMGQPITVRCIQ